MGEKLQSAGLSGRPLRKALALLEILAGAGVPLSLAEVARRCDQPKSSVHRMLGVLVDLDLAVSTDHGYALGDYLFDIVHHSDRAKADRLRRVLNPMLIDLQNRTHGVVAMGVLSGVDVRYVEVLYRHDHAQFVRRQPLMLPAHLTAVGRALLAFRPDLPERLDAIPAVDSAPGNEVERARLQAALRDVRSRGVAVLESRAAHGGAAVAAPVHIADEPPFIAVAVASPDRMDPRTADLVKRVADVAGTALTARFKSTTRI